MLVSDNVRDDSERDNPLFLFIVSKCCALLTFLAMISSWTRRCAVVCVRLGSVRRAKSLAKLVVAISLPHSFCGEARSVSFLTGRKSVLRLAKLNDNDRLVCLKPR